MEKWIEKWRLDRMTLMPEKVRVMPVSHNYMLVEGEEHTSYSGALFNTPAEAFAHELQEAERSIRHGTERKERIRQVQARLAKED